MDWVLVFLLVMLIGSILSVIIIPPYLDKIADDGSVKIFGIKFL